MYLYPKVNKYCYYAVKTESDKKLLISIAEKYGVKIDKPRSKIPFYFTVVVKVVQNNKTATYAPYIDVFKSDSYYFNYCFEADILHFEENLIVKYFGDIAQKRVNYIFHSGIVMGERYISKIYETADGRKFEISNNLYHYNVNVREDSHFRLGDMYKLPEMISVNEYLPESNKRVLAYCEKNGEYKITRFDDELGKEGCITHWCNLIHVPYQGK